MRPLARLRAAWVLLTGTGAAASVAFGLLVFVAVVASLAIPREGAALRTGALQHTLAAAPASDKTVIGTIDLASLLNSQQSPAAEMATVRADLASQLATDGVPLAGNPPAWSGLTSGYTPVTGAPAAAGGGRAKLEVMYRSALARYSRVVTGHLPVGTSIAGGRQIVQVAVTQPTAARFGLRVGSRLTAGRDMQIQVTGIIQPEHLDTGFWNENPGTVQPLLMPGSAAGSSYYIGAVFTGPGAVAQLATLLNPEYMQVSWVLPVRLNRLTADQAGSLLSSINGMTSTGLVIPGAAAGAAPVTTVSQLPGILGSFIAEDRAVAPLLGLMYVGLAVTGAVVVLLSAWLVAERRYAEFALIRARGAGLWDIAWRTLRASGAVAVVAAVAAAAVAVRLTPAQGSQLGWWLAGLTAAVTLAGPVLISVARHRAPGRATGGHARQAGPRRAATRRIVFEAGLILVTIGGLVVLRIQGLSAGGMNLFPSAAPVLIAVPAAIIVLRCYPAVARALARVAGRSRGVVGFVGLARATRTAAGATLPAFALVLVLGMIAFSAMVASAVTRGQVAASWREVGADAVVEAPANGVITPAVQHEIASVPGVASTATAVTEAGSLGSSGSELQAVFVNPARYAAVVDQAPGAAFPQAALSSSAPGGAFPAAATPAATQLAGRAPTVLDLDNQTVTFRVAGQIGGVPGLAKGALVVLPLRVLGENTQDPDLMLISGPHLDTQRLRAVVARGVPGGSLTLRSTALAALTGAPIPRAAQTTLVQGAVTAAGFGALVLLLSLVLGARSRDMTLARLATMGLRQDQAQLLVAVETLPQIVAVAIGGVACAAALAPLVGPSMDLSAFTGPGPSAVVVPDLAVLAASAAGLVLAALLALAAQAAVTYRRGSAGPLRIAE